MDAHLLGLLSPVLKRALIGAKVEKIQEIAPHHLAICCYAPGGKRYLYIRFDRQHPFCFISGRHVSGLSLPSAQVMRLRKYLGGRKILSVLVQTLSRKIWLLVSGSHEDRNTWLCLDLAKEASLYFLDSNSPPEEEILHWPSSAELPGALLNWREWPVLTPVLRRTLAALNEPEQRALVSDLADGGASLFIYRDPAGAIKGASAWPVPQFCNLEEENCEPVQEEFEKAGFAIIFDNLVDSQTKERMLPAEKRIKKILSILSKLDQDQKRLERMVAIEKDAMLLKANLWSFPQDYQAATIQVEIAGGSREIFLQQRFNLIENMQRMFHEASRGKRGLAMLASRRSALEQELKELKNGFILPSQPRDLKSGIKSSSIAPPHCAIFTSSDGYSILRGKDAKGNLLIRKLASPHDLWVHVEQGSGAHVIIRRSHPGEVIPESTLIQAGTLAANKSWLSGALSGSVMYAELRHVKVSRKGPLGKVLIDKILATRTVPVDRALEEKLKLQMSELQ